jgi:hypothetical protein
MWSQPDIAARKQTMDQILTPDISFQDAYSSTAGAEDLNAHLTGAQQFMPGISLVREGEIHLCQETALAHWVARKKDGSEMARGVNVFQLTADSRIRRITGFWLPQQS